MMNRLKFNIIFLFLLAGFFVTSCKNKTMDGVIIFTRISGKEMPSDLSAAVSDLAALRENGDVEILTGDFFSAMSPEVSFDGNSLLFTAKSKKTDPWQIFEMNFKNRKVSKITASVEDCLFPAYLPGEKIVFSRQNKNDSLKSACALYTCKMDGSALTRITYNPDSWTCSTVLKDGRILALTTGNSDENILNIFSHQPISTSTHPKINFMAMRPDGTKAELFYKGGIPFGKAHETDSGRLLFIEAEKAELPVKQITSIRYNNPLHSAVGLTAGLEGDFYSVFPMSSGKMLVSLRKSQSRHYDLYEFDPDQKMIGKSLYSNEEYNITDIVRVERRERPKKLPSEVDMSIKTGLLLCQNLNELDPNGTGDSASLGLATAVEVIGIDSLRSIIPVEKDGSFFLKIKANIPFRIRALDAKGNILRNACNWIWLRPNERRGCVGCHEDPYQVPENRVPLAVKKLPVNILLSGIDKNKKTIVQK